MHSYQQQVLFFSFLFQPPPPPPKVGTWGSWTITLPQLCNLVNTLSTNPTGHRCWLLYLPGGLHIRWWTCGKFYMFQVTALSPRGTRILGPPYTQLLRCWLFWNSHSLSPFPPPWVFFFFSKFSAGINDHVKIFHFCQENCHSPDRSHRHFSFLSQHKNSDSGKKMTWLHPRRNRSREKECLCTFL